MTVFCPVSQIVNPNLQRAGLPSFPNHSVLERPRKEFGENREDMKGHSSFNPSGISTSILRATGSISTQIDFANGIRICLSSLPLTSRSGGPPYSCHASTMPIDSPVDRSVLAIEFEPPLTQPRSRLETLKQAGPKVKEQLRSDPKKWAGIAAGAGIVLGLAGRYLRHRAHRPHLVVVETTAC